MSERRRPPRAGAAPGRSATRAAARTAALVAVAVAATLTGCSPEHNWREIRADAGFWVMLPARPSALTRSIDLDGQRVDMAMQGAQAREVTYTVGSVALPDASPASRERALAAMRIAMVRNIGGTEQASRPVEVSLVDPAGQPAGRVQGIEIEAVGRMRDREATLIARFVGTGSQVLQAVVLGPQPDREQASMFLESLKLVRR
jgi:hypothetical protein